MTPEFFRECNELLARFIYAPSSTEAMREAAKAARRSLFLYAYGTKNQPGPLHNMQRAYQPLNQTKRAE